MKMLSIHRPLPSTDMAKPASLRVAANSSLDVGGTRGSSVGGGGVGLAARVLVEPRVQVCQGVAEEDTGEGD